MHCFVARFLLLFLGTLVSLVHSKTDSPDVSALNVMFKSLNSPSQLRGWKSSGGDPCGDSWEGIECSGSSVTEINLRDHNLSGQLGYQLSSLSSVKIFDVSKNNLNGDVPYQLPPNAQRIDLSENKFDGNVPYSMSQMTNLEEVNLSRNRLEGQLSDMFAKVQKLKSFDVSYNKLSDTLPNSLANLSNLNTLHLQNNRFTGTINVLADLPLNDLNVENNKFTGWIPDELKGIDNLKTGGNSWSTGTAPPPPPGVQHRRRPDKEESEGSKISLRNGLLIGFSCLGGVTLLLFIICICTMRRSSPPPSSHFLEEDIIGRRKGFTPLHSQELDPEAYVGILKQPKDFKSTDPGNGEIKSLLKSPSMGLRRSASSRVSFSENEFANRLKGRRSTSVQVVPYSLADLQKSTDNFAPDRLLGEGTIGRVYRAKYPDGKVLAVKKIDSSLFQGQKSEEFSKLVANISKLHHPNIAELVGYCSEQGHNMLIYDYFRNGSLHDFLHVADDFSKPLTWNTRVRIALGVARAVEYLHDVCSPSMVHKNIKSSNILLDLELNPRLSDYGMANFHQRTSQNLGVGYNAPECIKPSAYTLRSDVYSFGVVMLELLTGRMPVDSERPSSEYCLVKWARPQLHDTDALFGMADPALRGLYPPKSLPPFADIVALCVQTDPERRAPMSEVVQALVRLVQQSAMNMKEDLSSSRRTTDSEYEIV
ncbi:STRUBBELIG-receptor family 5 [Hibiscus trionum]|uniref:STRUBBELIG-receptor family 5 n=1 Tax=Hibiscus trionum TaxID=183268 RepID=A0A9W7HZ88_HIBTR|nr:STRUBBELIG-receptor family 5 [Hibiscus trionum]